VARHEHFEELCAAASIGQATGAELAELQEHLACCPDCRQTYCDFLQFGAIRCSRAGEKQMSSEEAIGYIDSTLFRQKFLKRAEAEGVTFSRVKVPAVFPEPETPARHRIWSDTFKLSAAACLLLGAGLAGGYLLKSRDFAALPHAVNAPVAATINTSNANPSPATDPERDATVLRLEASNQKLSSEVAALRNSLALQSDTLNELRANVAASETKRESLLSDVTEREARTNDLQRQVSEAQAELAGVKSQLESTSASNQTVLAADQIRIHELTDEIAEQTSSLAREKDMLAANRDIRELMAARNLHIADVFDTDTKGKTRTAFGRIFYTEGKSLIFYAYDLNDNRVQTAGYNFRVWGKKEGPGHQAKSLGIFYSDDRAQKRWIFRYDDPKVLSEIDSVFVTLEPPGKQTNEPKGEKFLYAYLRNKANHP
jgi:hypothetical protein